MFDNVSNQHGALCIQFHTRTVLSMQAGKGRDEVCELSGKVGDVHIEYLYSH